VRRAEPRKRRDEIDAAVVGNACRERLDFGCGADDLQSVAQPLDDGSADENASFERVVESAIALPRDRRDRLFVEATATPPVFINRKQPVPYVFFASPGAWHACPKSAACWSPAMPAIGMATPPIFASAQTPDEGNDAWEHGARNVEATRGALRPNPRANVEQQRAARVRSIGNVHAALGQVPDEPGIDRAERELATARALAGTIDIVEQPGDLGPGKVRIEYETRLACESLARGRSAQRVTLRRRARSCQTIALAIGRPVARSHTSVVSRWLVIPIAAISRGRCRLEQ
jgi:hypothetical protein